MKVVPPQFISVLISVVVTLKRIVNGTFLCGYICATGRIVTTDSIVL